MAIARILFLLPFVAAIPFGDSRVSFRSPLVLSFPDNDYDIVDANEVCQTKECYIIANDIIDAMDKSADPCNNFWKYTCGKWATNHPILPGMAKTGRSDGNAAVEQLLSELLMEQSRFDIKPVRQAKLWYKSCVDTEKLDRIGLEPIASLTKGIGGWPITMENDDGDDLDNSWSEIDQYYRHLMGLSAFYDIAAAVKTDDYKYGDLYIETPQKLLDRKDVAYSESYLEILIDTIEKLVELNGGAISKTDYMVEARELIRFEQELLKLEQDYEGGRLVNDVLDWLNENETEHFKRRIDWMSEIESSFAPLGISLGPDTVVFASRQYMRELDELLSKTSSRTIVNYIHWNFIFSMLPYTTESFRDRISKLYHDNEIEREPRWLECEKEMKMSYAAAHVFAKKYLPDSVRKSNREIIENIQTVLVNEIDNSNWLDERSKSILKQKAENVTVVYGIPDWYSNETALINYYKGLRTHSDYFYTTLGYVKFDRQRKLKVYVLDEEIGPETNILSDGASYYTKKNIIDAGVKIFKPPPLIPGVPNNVNYGAIGAIIGHEVGHGLDSDGIRTGIISSELSNNTLKTYNQGPNCVVKQYNNLLKNALPDDEATKKYEHVGKSTLNENVADIIGLEVAFDAYKYHKRNEGGLDERKLPGLEELSDEQLYFVAFASTYCEILSPEFEEAILMDDGHMTNYYRVIGPIMNSNGFAEAFNCRKGSPMNPIEKCNIWNHSLSSTENEVDAEEEDYILLLKPTEEEEEEEEEEGKLTKERGVEDLENGVDEGTSEEQSEEFVPGRLTKTGLRDWFNTMIDAQNLRLGKMLH